jgi:hypothetical protein
MQFQTPSAPEPKDVEGARVVSLASYVDASNAVNKPVPKEMKAGSMIMLVQ